MCVCVWFIVNSYEEYRMASSYLNMNEIRQIELIKWEHI